MCHETFAFVEMRIQVHVLDMILSVFKAFWSEMKQMYDLG